MVWDNATFDSCAKARKYLARWGDRIALHFSPQYAAKANPIERHCCHLRGQSTADRRRKTIDPLIELDNACLSHSWDGISTGSCLA
jgi:transposase